MILNLKGVGWQGLAAPPPPNPTRSKFLQFTSSIHTIERHLYYLDVDGTAYS